MTEKNIVVSIVEPVGGHGGMNYYDFGLCRGLANSGATVRLYTCDETQVESALPFQVRRYYLKIYGVDSVWKRGFRFILGSLRSISEARSIGCRLFHYHFFHVGPLELFNVLVTRALGGVVVITAHDVEAFKDGLTVGPLAILTYRLSSRIIAHNQVSRNELINQMRVDPNKIDIIPHGNYINYFPRGGSRSFAREKFGLSNDYKVILFFGQIKEVKGLDILLEALGEVSQSLTDVYLIIAGKIWKDDFSKYQEIIDRNGLESRCVLRIEYIPDRDVVDYFTVADLVVCPYRRIYQSGVVLMAMSSGCPVLASDIDGMKEVITDGDSGFLFNSGDPYSLAQKLNYVFSNPRLLNAVAERAKKYMREKYDWNNIGRMTTSSYQRAIFTIA